MTLNNQLLKLNRGVGLVELLVSLVVISVSVLGLVTLQTSIMTSSRSAENQLAALYLAESHMERLRAENRTLSSNSSREFQQGKFLVTTQSREMTAADGDNVKGANRLQVHIEWQAVGSSKQNSVSLVSVVAIRV